jgi:hypothetical protein
MSWAISTSPLVGEKGLGSNLLAAMGMLIIGTAFEVAGNHVSWRCRIPMNLSEWT